MAFSSREKACSAWLSSEYHVMSDGNVDTHTDLDIPWLVFPFEHLQNMMTWRPQYRSSKFRHVFGKAATKENCYDGVPITRSVHDNHFCAVNPRFIAVITECAGGGAFLVLSVHHVSLRPPLHFF
eukprot:XP_014050375.1 PREDICTED: coronin-2A-like [Salmo salar]